MILEMTVNNYIYGIINRQLKHYVITDKKVDSKHHLINFNVNSQNEISLIQKVTTYKGIIKE